MTDDERRELRDLMQAHDQMMTEHQEWMAAREAAAASPMQKSGAEAILYRVHEQNTQPPADDNGPVPSDDEQYPAYSVLKESIGYVIAHERASVRKALAKRDERITKLEAKLDAVLTMLGQKSNFPTMGKSEVVELPRGFLRKVHANG